MNPNVAQRFIRYMTAVLVVVVVAGTGYIMFGHPGQAPGDYEVRKGDILLGDEEYSQALEWFDKALEETPNHRGALMGRAIVFLQTEQYDRAERELTNLIQFMTENFDNDDATGIAVLAGAYANRGILYDRTGRYEKALADYVMALEVDEGAVSGPDLFYKILHDPRPSTVRDRARYIYEQLQLPEDQRLMRVPDMDARQRMFKP